MRKIGAVILAAGGSSRFGQPKQLISFRGKSLLRRVIDTAHEARCSPIVVVIGSYGEKVARELQQTGVTSVENKQWQRGIGSSIRIGVQRLIDNVPGAEAIVLLVCDQPAVNARVVKRLITLHSTTKKKIIASSYADTLGVPALFSRPFFPDLLSLDDSAGAKSIILRNRGCVAQMPFPGGKIDIDGWNDYKSLTSNL
jgi:molybdenum cofactor cytidylyltransferase